MPLAEIVQVAGASEKHWSLLLFPPDAASALPAMTPSAATIATSEIVTLCCIVLSPLNGTYHRWLDSRCLVLRNAPFLCTFGKAYPSGANSSLDLPGSNPSRGFLVIPEKV